MTTTAERPTTRAEWKALLRRRIEESGLSARKFAREVLRRDERNVRRWLSEDDHPIPQLVQDFLVDPTPAPWPEPEWDDDDDEDEDAA